MNFQLYGKRVLLRKLAKDERYVADGKIQIPVAHQKEKSMAEVISLGTDCENSDMSVGDIVYMPALVNAITIDGIEYTICREGEIIGKMLKVMAKIKA